MIALRPPCGPNVRLALCGPSAYPSAAAANQHCVLSCALRLVAQDTRFAHLSDVFNSGFRLMRRTLILLCLILLTGCGAEVAGTAATAAAAKAEEARHAERMQQEVVERYQREMEAAQQLRQQKLQEAER